MKAPDDPNADLRRQIAEQRAARTNAVARLKLAAQKAADGKNTPITDKFKLPDDDSSESDDDHHAIEELRPGDESPAVKRLRPRLNQARRAHTAEVRTLQQATLAVVQIVRQDAVEGLNGNVLKSKNGTS